MAKPRSKIGVALSERKVLEALRKITTTADISRVEAQPMPISPRQERIIALGRELLKEAGLPCHIIFRKGTHTARHVRLQRSGCVIQINPEVSISAPQHIILHEAAHHGRSKREQMHGLKWARRLIKLYEITKTPPPHSTKFESFRKLAGLRPRIAPPGE